MPYHVGTSSECPSSKPHAVIKDSDGKVMGCHATRQDANDQLAALYASEGDQVTQTIPLATTSPAVTGEGYAENMAFSAGTPWEGVLAVEDVETGDGRMFAPMAITWAELPIPLRWNMEDSHGGQATTKAVLVGRIDSVWRDPENPMVVRGAGVFDDQGANGAEALRLVQSKFLKGISVDPDNISDADVELVFPDGGGDNPLEELFAMPELTIFHAGRLRGATLVDIPAFVEAKIWLVDPNTVPQSQTASAHFGQISDRAWSGPAFEERLGMKLTQRSLRTAYAHLEKGATEQVHARFLHHEIDDEGAVGLANLTACSAGIRVINAGRADSLSVAERRIAYEHMAHHLRSAGLTPAPYEADEVITASAFDDIVKPPAEWFVDPNFSELTPITITDDGHVFGHGAAWRSCHTGYKDACVSPPREPHGDHTYFRLGEVLCADGSRVAVGSITLGTGHAPTRAGLTAQAAAEHYDNTGAVVALVASGEDDHGIWVNGYVKPGTPAARIAELRAAPLSGDWRRIGGQLRLVAFLAVNHPGFPVPRTSAFVSNRKQLALVAAGVVSQDMRHATTSPELKHAMERIARSIGRDDQSRMEQIKARVRG